MTIHFNNINTLWAAILVETLYRLGLSTAIVCPGSRSAPLAVALAQHEAIEAIPVLDERSAAFFALGLAQQTGKAVALICTSGTAGANFYPAVIEARESRVPLLVLTADRPPELRECNAGQAIDQQKLYGGFANWYHELALPGLERLDYLRQVVMQAWERTQYPVAGAVHLNVPLREPLAPIVQPEVRQWGEQVGGVDGWMGGWVEEWGGEGVRGWGSAGVRRLVGEWGGAVRPLIVAGVAQPRSGRGDDSGREENAGREYCQAIGRLAGWLQAPVLAEGLSPVRNFAALNPYLVTTYDFLLRDRELAEKLEPDLVIRVGDMPTSKMLRQWLTKVRPLQWVIDPSDRNLDPLHGRTRHVRLSIEQLVEQLGSVFDRSVFQHSTGILSQSAAKTEGYCRPYCDLWCRLDAQMRQAIDRRFQATEHFVEGKVAWLLSQHLPPATPLFIANSTPIRDLEWFWRSSDLMIRPFFNRGANGIDGTLSTALGMAHGQQSGVLLTGDLALLHDTNGLLIRPKFRGHLTIVLINNNGGGIFELLPIAQFDPPFEEFFATPQSIDFAQLCQTYQVEHEVMQSWQQLIDRLNPLPKSGIRVLEVRCDRKADARWVKEFRP